MDPILAALLAAILEVIESPDPILS